MFVVGALAPFLISHVVFFNPKIGAKAPTTNVTHTKRDILFFYKSALYSPARHK